MYHCSLPEHYYYFDKDSMQLAIWDEERSTWSSNKSLFQDVAFDLGTCTYYIHDRILCFISSQFNFVSFFIASEERMVSFKLLRFAPMAIMSVCGI